MVRGWLLDGQVRQLSKNTLAAREFLTDKLLWFLRQREYAECGTAELCGLKRKDLDLQGRRCTVLGKGNKTRPLFFGKDTTRSLWAYLKDEPRDLDDYLFLSDRGETAGEPLTRSGLLQLIRRLGKAA